MIAKHVFEPVATPDQCVACQTNKRLLDSIYENWEDGKENDANVLESLLDEHKRLHDIIANLVTNPSVEIKRYTDPEWTWIDRLNAHVLRSPLMGVTEKGKAFYLLNRHRFTNFVRAGVFDYKDSGWPLRLVDDQNQQLWIDGCTSGYGGEGPHGTFWILRQAGFDTPDLDQFVFHKEYFTISKGAIK